MKGKRILSVLLTLILMLNIALAVEGKAEAKESEEMSAGIAAPEGIAEAAQNAGRKAKQAKGIEATSMYRSSTKTPAYRNYEVTSNTYWVIEIAAKDSGHLWLDYKVSGVEGTTSQIVIQLVDKENRDLFKADPTSTNFQSYVSTQGRYYVGDSAQNKGPVYLNKGEVYYLLVTNWGTTDQPDVTVGIRAKIYTTSSRTLAQGTSQWTLVSGINKNGDDASTTYFKVVPQKTGVMTVSLKQYGYHNKYGSSGKIQLLNSNKKSLSNAVTYNSKNSASRAYFGVKKGVTYYLKVTNCYGSPEYNYKYGIQYGITTRTDRAIGTKSSAKKLSRKASATNTLFVASTNESTDWYKFVVSETRSSEIVVNAANIKSGSLKVYLYLGSQKIDIKNEKVPANNKLTIIGTLPRGTYYLKVVKGTKASGNYTVRYVK